MTASSADGKSMARRRVLIIVENLPVPFDRRVWSEATTLQNHGYQVSVICPSRSNVAITSWTSSKLQP